jgi:mycothiol S-conjugate amidase
VIGVPDPLCLLTVHAHPDDESSKGAGSVALYHAAGVRTVLVCCTGGEEGEVLNPAMDTPEVHARLADLRREELGEAARVIGYDEVVMLGYRDSGMAGSEANANPASFAQAPLEEAVERLVGIVRRTRPQVMVVYGDEQSGYPHPDHLRVHEIGVPAFLAAGDPDRFPGSGSPWQPEKLYYTEFSVARFREVHQKFEELGLESPFDAEWRKRWEEITPPVVTTSVDVSDFADIRSRALLAHATQVDPKSPFWFGLPPEVMRTIHPYDDYRLALVVGPDGSIAPPDERDGGGDRPVETDLFAGVRTVDSTSGAAG